MGDSTQRTAGRALYLAGEGIEPPSPRCKHGIVAVGPTGPRRYSTQALPCCQRKSFPCKWLRQRVLYRFRGVRRKE